MRERGRPRRPSQLLPKRQSLIPETESRWLPRFDILGRREGIATRYFEEKWDLLNHLSIWLVCACPVGSVGDEARASRAMLDRDHGISCTFTIRHV